MFLFNLYEFPPVHQLINYFVFERERKKIPISKLTNLTNKWIHKGESYCNLQIAHAVTRT